MKSSVPQVFVTIPGFSPANGMSSMLNVIQALSAPVLEVQPDAPHPFDDPPAPLDRRQLDSRDAARITLELLVCLPRLRALLSDLEHCEDESIACEVEPYWNAYNAIVAKIRSVVEVIDPDTARDEPRFRRLFAIQDRQS